MKYATPEVALMAYEAKDVITASTGGEGEEDDQGGVTLPED